MYFTLTWRNPQLEMNDLAFEWLLVWQYVLFTRFKLDEIKYHYILTPRALSQSIYILIS